MVYNNSWQPLIDFNLDQIPNLTKFYVKHTFCQFSDNVAKQKESMSMTSPMPLILYKIFMIRFEEEAITTFSYKPHLLVRYVDDSFVL